MPLEGHDNIESAVFKVLTRFQQGHEHCNLLYDPNDKPETP